MTSGLPSMTRLMLPRTRSTTLLSVSRSAPWETGPGTSRPFLVLGGALRAGPPVRPASGRTRSAGHDRSFSTTYVARAMLILSRGITVRFRNRPSHAVLPPFLGRRRTTCSHHPPPLHPRPGTPALHSAPTGGLDGVGRDRSEMRGDVVDGGAEWSTVVQSGGWVEPGGGARCSWAPTPRSWTRRTGSSSPPSSGTSSRRDSW